MSAVIADSELRRSVLSSYGVFVPSKGKNEKRPKRKRSESAAQAGVSSAQKVLAALLAKEEAESKKP